jgi:hypothetical protein
MRLFVFIPIRHRAGTAKQKTGITFQYNQYLDISALTDDRFVVIGLYRKK